MNERIKELAEQAENHAYRVAAAGDDCQEAYTQKFAELIVKECASICRDRKLTPSAFTADELLEHFGVE